MIPAIDALALSLFVFGLALMAAGVVVLAALLPGIRPIDRATVVIGIGVLAWIAGATSLGWPE